MNKMPKDREELSAFLLFLVRSSCDQRFLREFSERQMGAADWFALLNLAEMHGVLPLVCHNLKTHVSDQLPEEVYQRIVQRLGTYATRNMRLIGLLEELLDHFEKKGIKVLAVKGPVSSERFYGNLHSRHYCDLDFLISIQSVPEAVQLLAGAGGVNRADGANISAKRCSPPTKREGMEGVAWEAGTARPNGMIPIFRLNRTQLNHYSKYQHELYFANADNTLNVDLHWQSGHAHFDLLPSFDLMYARRESVELDGADIPALNRRDQFLYACSHGTQHGWLKLKYLCDLYESFLPLSEDELNECLINSTKQRKRDQLLLGLYLLQKLFDVALPGSVCKAIGSHAGIERIGEDVSWLLLSPASFADRQKTWKAIEHKLVKKTGGYARYLLHQSIRPSGIEIEAVSLPLCLGGLYYVIRAARLGYKYTFGRVSRPVGGDSLIAE